MARKVLSQAVIMEPMKADPSAQDQPIGLKTQGILANEFRKGRVKMIKQKKDSQEFRGTTLKNMDGLYSMCSSCCKSFGLFVSSTFFLCN